MRWLAGSEAASSMGRKFSVSAEVRSAEARAGGGVERDGVEFGADELAAVRAGFFGGESAQGGHAFVDDWRRERVIRRGESMRACRGGEKTERDAGSRRGDARMKS